MDVHEIENVLQRVMLLFQEADSIEHATTVSRMIGEIQANTHDSAGNALADDSLDVENVIFGLPKNSMDFTNDPVSSHASAIFLFMLFDS